MITKEQDIELVYQSIINHNNFTLGYSKYSIWIHSYNNEFEVIWNEILDGMSVKSFKEFKEAEEAASFFIDKLYHIKESQI